MYSQCMCAGTRYMCTRETQHAFTRKNTSIYHPYIQIPSRIYPCIECVYRMQSVLILSTSYYSSTHVAKHCTDNPCFACLRALFGFILGKYRTSRKSTLYKEPCIRTRTLHLRIRTLYLHTRVLYICTNETQRWYITTDKQTLDLMCLLQHIYPKIMLKHKECSLCKCCPHTFILILFKFSLFTHARRRSKQ